MRTAGLLLGICVTVSATARQDEAASTDEPTKPVSGLIEGSPAAEDNTLPSAPGQGTSEFPEDAAPATGETEATPEAPEEPDPCERDAPRDAELVDRSRMFLEEKTCGAALWFDGLFGDDRNIDEARRTSGYLETSIAYSQFYGTETDTRFRIYTELPNLRDRASVFLGRDDDDEFIRDRDEEFAVRSRFGSANERQWIGGIGYQLPSHRGFSSNVNVGVSNLREPYLFLQYKMRLMAVDLKRQQLEFRLTPFYTTRDREGVTAGVDYNYLISPDLMFRWSSRGTVSDRIDGLSWHEALLLYINLKHAKALTYELYVNGETDEREPLREYGLRQIFTFPIVERKLFGEALVGYGWPRKNPDEDRNGAYEIGFSLRLPFGGGKASDNRRRTVTQNEGDGERGYGVATSSVVAAPR